MKNQKHTTVWNQDIERRIDANGYGKYPGLSGYADNMMHGQVKWQLFETGTTFARFVTLQHNSPIAAEYLTIEAYNEIERLAIEYRKHIVEIWRHHAAVLEKWNPKPKRVVFIRLEQPAYGLVGPIAPQIEEQIQDEENQKYNELFGNGTGAYVKRGVTIYFGGAYNKRFTQVLFPHLAKSVKAIVNTKEDLGYDYDENGMSIKICDHKVIE
jgi:hypothetical protein